MKLGVLTKLSSEPQASACAASRMRRMFLLVGFVRALKASPESNHTQTAVESKSPIGFHYCCVLSRIVKDGRLGGGRPGKLTLRTFMYTKLDIAAIQKQSRRAGACTCHLFLSNDCCNLTAGASDLPYMTRAFSVSV